MAIRILTRDAAVVEMVTEGVVVVPAVAAEVVEEIDLEPAILYEGQNSYIQHFKSN